MTDNVGYIQIGTSHDTTEFACDSIRHWWNSYGTVRYPLATSILLLCDGGGSNSSRYYLFKQDLQGLANEMGIEIRIAHYPPYTSKYNPIEHRLFPHVSRACQGMIFDTIETVQDRQAEEIDLLERVVEQHPDLSLLVELADEFLQLLRQRQADAFDDWLLKAASCALKPLQTFVKGLLDDYAAVKASLMTEFSNGPVEGLNNKLKMLKRQELC